jgi:citrate synthase
MSTAPAPRLTAREAADRLGVKVATVYAYVSRGHLQSETAPDGRTSTFDPRAVEAMARRGRPRRSTRSPTLDLELSTALTEVRDGRLRYRGLDAVELSRRCTFEQVAELLWRDVDPRSSSTGVTDDWPEGEAVPVPDGTDLDRLRAVVVWSAAADPTAADLHPAAVASTARRLIGCMVASLPRSSQRAPRLRLDGEQLVARSVATALSSRLGERRADAGVVAWVNAALCLLADHELAASTLAARVAASARADPYGVVIAGLGPFGGSLHGTASRQVRELLDRAERSGPGAAVAHSLRTQGTVPGFGHSLYPGGDPRATELLARLDRTRSHRRAATPDRRLDTVHAVRELAASRTGVHANVDLAIGAFGHVHGLRHDAGDALFGIARTAGWIAHGLEEYGERPLRFRPRARYVGVPPRELT